MSLGREQQIETLARREERRVRSLVESGNLSIDRLIERCGNEAGRRAALLSDAELAAEVENAESTEINGLAYSTLVEAYENGGPSAVESLCEAHGITERAYCGPCETDTPTFGGVCAVCGTVRD